MTETKHSNIQLLPIPPQYTPVISGNSWTISAPIQTEEEPELKYCPINNQLCKEKLCAWWNQKQESCCIPLLIEIIYQGR